MRRPCRSTCRNIETITKEEMIDLMKTNENVILLDVRSKQEYEEGHLNRKYKYTGI